LTVLAFPIPEHDPTAQSTTIAPSLFVVPKPQPTFDYAAFRAEFVRLKQQTSYQRANEKAEQAKKERVVESVDGVPVWALYQFALGIAATIHAWQWERYHDPTATAHHVTLIRYTYGLLERVRAYQVEPEALASIDAQALVWCASQGRTWLWQDEHRAVNLDRRYMRECDTFKFKAKYPSFEPKYRSDGRMIERIRLAWVARQMELGALQTWMLLSAAETVFKQRAMLDMDAAPEVRLRAPRIATVPAAEGEETVIEKAA
jgi:hypothetical protein